MAVMYNCRIVWDVIYSLEVELAASYIRIAGFDPLQHRELLNLFSKVEQPADNLFRHETMDRSWRVEYEGKIGEGILDHFLPVGWKRLGKLNHLFTLHEDFNFFLDHMMDATPEIEEARRLNDQMAAIMVKMSKNVIPIKRWNQLSDKDVRTAFAHYEMGISEIDELKASKKVLEKFLNDKTGLDDLGKEIIEHWYETWYNFQKINGCDGGLV